MPIDYQPEVVVLSGECPVEDAFDLMEQIRAQPDRPVDLAGCSHAHTAVLQVLIALRPPIAAAPADPFLQACLA